MQATESGNNYELIVEIITAWKALTIATDVVLTATSESASTFPSRAQGQSMSRC